jgi:hypothetical protein
MHVSKYVFFFFFQQETRFITFRQVYERDRGGEGVGGLGLGGWVSSQLFCYLPVNPFVLVLGEVPGGLTSSSGTCRLDRLGLGPCGSVPCSGYLAGPLG